MRTPIADFIRHYTQSGTVRFHMPGHKGRGPIGCEPFDITEISGADELYAPDNIIAQSEANAAELFHAARTAYSTEGSSQCIRAMVYLAALRAKFQTHPESPTDHPGFPTDRPESPTDRPEFPGQSPGLSANHPESPTDHPVIVAARNVHSAFVYAAALSDVRIVWLWPENRGSLCACPISPEQLRHTLEHLTTPPAAVYLTSPDYLGGLADIPALAQVCHAFHTPLLVDNAHGAYLRFLNPSKHPLDLGADMCCDSAHKTFPVLTGGAYLHIAHNAPDMFRENVKTAMALFGSTSPSWLTLMSLDLCNGYLADQYRGSLAEMVTRLDTLRDTLRRRHWRVEHSDPLRLTLRGDTACIGERLHNAGIEWEYLDRDYIVLMFTPHNSPEELDRLTAALGDSPKPDESPPPPSMPMGYCETVLTPREAIFAPGERIPVEGAVGRVCAAPTVSCPPAVPIAIAGERVSREAAEIFVRYGVRMVQVVREG